MDVEGRRLGLNLMQRGLIDAFELSSALHHQTQRGISFAEALLQLGFLNEGTLLQALSHYYGLAAIQLDLVVIAPEVLRTIPVDFCRQRGVLPIAFRQQLGKQHLVVAVGDPGQLALMAELDFIAGQPTVKVVASYPALRRTFARLWGQSSEVAKAASLQAERFLIQRLCQQGILQDTQGRFLLGHQQPVAILARLLYRQSQISREDFLQILKHLEIREAPSDACHS